MRALCLLAAFPLVVAAQEAPSQPVFDVRAMMGLARISEPQISPDGKKIAFTVDRVELDKGTKPKQIFVVPIAGGTPVQITTDGTRNERPRWLPDSSKLVFHSNRSGSSQVWIMDADGANAKQVTSLSTEASGAVVSPDGKRVLFTSDVFPDCLDEACNKGKLDAANANPVKARVYTSLLYRHWTDWQTARRKHLMVADIEGGPARDLTPGSADVPTFSLGGPDDYAISPDNAEVAYVANTDANQATSTNTEIFTVPITGGEAKKITTSPGSDRSPAYSPDGKKLAFRSQARAGYESDRWRLALFDRASSQITILNEGEDRPVEGLTWSLDGSRLFYTLEDRGRSSISTIPASGGASRNVISGAGHFDDVQFADGGKVMIYTEQSGSKPTEIYRASSGGGAAVALTNLNTELLSRYQLSPLEELWVERAGEPRVHSFIVKPPGFQAGRKFPVLFLIHGGPQGAWGESWSYRWNPQVFAAAGYVVVMPNPRGSTGYGQKYTDDINADWGGKVYDDIMAVVDHVAGLKYVDADRMAAAGASYGGYMVNWMLGHTQRFRAFVSHAGLFDLRGMAGETEELWFPMWEFKGMPWENPELYAQLSPGTFAKEFKTPTLVTHGELDYRVPLGQGLQLFTALQLQKVPSKLVLFPDEGHWILNPRNSVFWYDNVQEWLKEWTAPRPAPAP